MDDRNGANGVTALVDHNLGIQYNSLTEAITSEDPNNNGCQLTTAIMLLVLGLLTLAHALIYGHYPAAVVDFFLIYAFIGIVVVTILLAIRYQKTTL